MSSAVAMLAACAVLPAASGADLSPPTAASARDGQSTPPAALAARTTLRHAPSRFAIQAPAGYRLRVSRGVYVLRRGKTSISFSRVVTSTRPGQFGAALQAQLGGRVLSRTANARAFALVLDRGTTRESILIRRGGGRLTVTTGRTPGSRPVSLATLRRVAGSARGGVALRPPRTAGRATRPIPLVSYRAPDGGATALVPRGWNVNSSGGTVEGGSTRGSFLFGFSLNVLLPESLLPGMPPTGVVSPYLPAGAALAQIFPQLAPSVSDIRIRSVLRDAIFPTFTSSAMYLISYRINGRPWVGAVTVATDHPSKYSYFVWNFYYSGIGVPAGSSPDVGVALLRAWRSWNPSGAIAQRTREAQQLMNETNEIWRQTSEFRSRTADPQARDVGCLLLGYYHIEDRSRAFDLPPLPCGQVYIERR